MIYSCILSVVCLVILGSTGSFSTSHLKRNVRTSSEKNDSNPSPSSFPSPSPSDTTVSESETDDDTVDDDTTTTTQPTSAPLNQSKRPNIVFIMTDEHNLRTLSCYRNYLTSKYNESDVNVWGDNTTKLQTVHLDRLAKEGALLTNFYTVSPACTPSRASFLSGLYPHHTGDSFRNQGPMDANIKTWAAILQEKKSYYTGFIGKWHLDGEERPGWNLGKDRPFGFNETKYRYNRGHWKIFDEVNGTVNAYEMSAKTNYSYSLRDNFSTDFLFDRCIDFISRATQRNDPFAVFLSIPDPHSPNQNRPWFGNMFMDLQFKIPQSAFAAFTSNPATLPMTLFESNNSWSFEDASNFLTEFERSDTFQNNNMQQYFGMVKCIDFNVGKLLQYLKKSGLDDDTMIVFTSDHGDMLFEHGKLNKGEPYQTSAGVPFIIRYPGVIPENKVIATTYSSIDVFPTILSLTGIDLKDVHEPFHGVDFSPQLLSTSISENDEERIIILMDSANNRWIAAATSRYKFIVSAGNNTPFLFDLQIDPQEMHNRIHLNEYANIKLKLQRALESAMIRYEMTFQKRHNSSLFDVPACIDTKDVFSVSGEYIRCTLLEDSPQSSDLCSTEIEVAQHCPSSCQTCACEDSKGLIFHNGALTQCGEHLQNECATDELVRLFCPKLCHAC